jgi:endonuclease I
LIKTIEMKHLTSIILISLIWGNLFGQATLPTGWNFDDPTPTGWVESLDNNPGNTRYTQTTVSGSACRLDGDDEYVMVHFSDVCGGVTYYIFGSGANLTNDVFSIQESADGNSWTNMRELVGADLNPSTYTEYTDYPQPTSRYIRWYFTEKQSGRNVALDEITLDAQIPTNVQEIGVNVAGTQVPNNSTYVFGSASSTTFTIENVNLSGGDTLFISDAQISGPDAADFSITGLTFPDTVDAASSIDFDLNFSTIGTGSRFATITLSNNDGNGDETSYVIDIYAIAGDYATEPTAQPTLQIDNPMTYYYEVQLQDANQVPENYIVTRGIGTTTLAPPVDGVTYVKGDYIDANTQVVHVGPAATFKPNYIVAATAYYHEAYSFNGPEGYENYLTNSPTTFPIVTPDNHVANYYAGVDAGANTFINDLTTKLSQNYNQIYYSNYAPVVIDKFASRDTTDGQKVVTCVYTGFQHVYSGAFFYSPIGDLSREHSWPHTWMPTYDATEELEYSDLHNLFPTHQTGANSPRSNRPFGVVETVITTFQEGTYGLDANGNPVYEPRDQHKGDAARAIFYMAVKWNGTGGSWALPNPIHPVNVPYGQDQDVLKQWHWQDPPDAWEIARNDFVQSEQGNRNPFVDSVNWVCYIDFETLTYIGEQTTPCAVTPDGIEEQLEGDFSISPNPTDGVAALNLNLKDAQELTINIVDITGRTVSTRTKNFSVGMSREMLDLSNLDAGIYHVVLQGENGRTALKVVLR